MAKAEYWSHHFCYIELNSNFMICEITGNLALDRRQSILANAYLLICAVSTIDLSIDRNSAMRIKTEQGR